MTTKISLGKADWRRSIAKEATLPLTNRYFEVNPVLNDELSSLISRPGLRKAFEIGEGPIRALYTCPGAFDEAVFAMSGLDLYKVEGDETVTNIGPVGSSFTSSASMVATNKIGDSVPNYLYICDGGLLYIYNEEGFGVGFLYSNGTISDTDTVRIGSVYYQFVTSGVDTGTPAGTSGNPWKVLIGGTVNDSLLNLSNAINANGVAGTDYSTDLVVHPEATAYSTDDDPLAVRSKIPGSIGNLVTTETSATMTWANPTLVGGGSPSLTQVLTPDDFSVISVAHINGYVIVIPAQEESYSGRFYWIRPGETVIDPLDFATNERSPDAILQVRVFSDQVFFFGQSTTENWITTGDADAPFQRFQGVLYDRGTWEGTAVQVKDSICVVDTEGSVLMVAGGVKVISNPAVEELIRRAVDLQRAS